MLVFLLCVGGDCSIICKHHISYQSLSYFHFGLEVCEIRQCRSVRFVGRIPLFPCQRFKYIYLNIAHIIVQPVDSHEFYNNAEKRDTLSYTVHIKHRSKYSTILLT